MAFSIEDQLTSDMDIFIPTKLSCRKTIQIEKVMLSEYRMNLPSLNEKSSIGLSGIHVASAGGILPERLMELDNVLNNNASKFRMARQQFRYLVNPNLNEIMRFKSAYHRELYIEDFVDKARKGFISFDKTDISNPLDGEFHLVACPIWTKNQYSTVSDLGLETIPFVEDILNNFFKDSDLFRKFHLFEGI